MRILVTGCAGFMGSHLVDELISRGHQVTGIDDLSGGFMENVNSECDFYNFDLRKEEEIDAAVKGQDAIFHLAAYAAEGQSVFSPKAINDRNIRPMNNLLTAAVNHGVEDFIFTSSMAVYGEQEPPFDEMMDKRPVDPYGCGKAYCEDMLRIFSETYHFRSAIIRPHNVYGQRQNIADPYRNVLGIWMNLILRGRPPYIYGDGEQVRAFSFIEDITPPLANALDHRSTLINLGGATTCTINEACRTLLKVMGSDLEPVYLEARPREVKVAYCTTARSKAALGYQERHTLEQGLTKMYEWVKSIGPQKPSYRIPLEIIKHAPKVWREQMI